MTLDEKSKKEADTHMNTKASYHLSPVTQVPSQRSILSTTDDKTSSGTSTDSSQVDGISKEGYLKQKGKFNCMN